MNPRYISDRYVESLLYDIYALLDPCDTLSFITPLVAKTFDILLDILHEPFVVYTAVIEPIVANNGV